MADCYVPFIVDWIQYLAPILFLAEANKKVYDGNVDAKWRKKYEETNFAGKEEEIYDTSAKTIIARIARIASL